MKLRFDVLGWIVACALLVGAVGMWIVYQDQRSRDRLEQIEAADLEACRAGNAANAATRELAATIGNILVTGLEMSEHSAMYASLVEGQINQAILEAERSDRDCNGDGQVDEQDYPDA